MWSLGVLLASIVLLGVLLVMQSKDNAAKCKDGYVLLTRAAEDRLCVPGYRLEPGD